MLSNCVRSRKSVEVALRSSHTVSFGPGLHHPTACWGYFGEEVQNATWVSMAFGPDWGTATGAHVRHGKISSCSCNELSFSMSSGALWDGSGWSNCGSVSVSVCKSGSRQDYTMVPCHTVRRTNQAIQRCAYFTKCLSDSNHMFHWFTVTLLLLSLQF